MKISTIVAFILFSFGIAQAGSLAEDSNSAAHPTLEDKELAEHAKGDKKFNPVEVIMTHISDDHEWHLWGEGDSSFSIPLPIILFDGGLKFFMSSEYHKKAVVNKEGTFYKLYNERGGPEKRYRARIYKTDAQGTIHLDENNQPTNEEPLDFSITKNVASMLLSVLILILLFVPMSASYKKSLVPTGFAGFMEPIILFIRDEVVRPNIGEKKYERYMPYLLTLFFFIWINNMLGLLPGAVNLTGNIAVTLVLAVIALIVINLSGNKSYWGHMLWMPGVPVPVKILLMPIELVGIITKPFALMIRLFANITAGHIIILSLVSLIFIFESSTVAIGAVPLVLFMNVLELLVAFLQAFIFTMLVALFIGTAVQEHEEAH